MKNTEINTDKTIEFNYELYLTGDYNAYHKEDLSKTIDIVSFRYEYIIGWCDDKNMAFCYTPSVVVLKKKSRIVWINVVRNRHGVIFSRTTDTPNTKPQSGNVMIKQYELEILD